MKKEIFEKYSLVLFIFLIGSFIGFVHENLLTIFQGQFLLKQGLIYEPLIPVYGLGALVFYYIYRDVKVDKKKKLLRILITFTIGLIVGGFTEYMCSLAQEKIFGTISWNYTYLKFNLNGRTSLLHASFWGLTGVLFYEFLLPFFKTLEKRIHTKPRQTLTLVLSAILLIDCTISCVACLRQDRRREGILPQNHIEEFLDYHYPDEYLNKIYTNAKPSK